MCAELIPRPVASNPDLLKSLASPAFTTVRLKEDPRALYRVIWYYTSGFVLYLCYGHADFTNRDVSVLRSEGVTQGAKLSFAKGSSAILLGDDCRPDLCGCYFLHSK